MKIVFLVLGRDMPSSRFRVLHYLPFLVERQVKFRLFEAQPAVRAAFMKRPARVWHYTRTLSACWRSDLVFLQKPGFIAHRWIYLRLLFGLRRRVVFDFDDAVFIDRVTGKPQEQSMLAKLEFIMRRSAMVIAGNLYLAELAKKYNSRVEIVPTLIDTEHYCPAASRLAGRPATIGWMGTAANLEHLFRLVPVMKRILSWTGVKFLVVSSLEKKPEELDFSDRVEFKTWRAATEVDDLWSLDIGIMPLDDDPYTRGKCGFKLLQYMSVAIPVVASPVGANARIVEDGVNGFLARTEEQWVEKLTELCRDPGLRQRMGAAGREKVLREFSLQQEAPRWISLLEQVAGR